MKTIPLPLLSLVACAFFMCSCQTGQTDGWRLIRASVSLDGQVLLTGSTSDDGYVDADGVWEYLKGIKFQPTEAFKKLQVDPTAKETVLTSKGLKGELVEIVVDIAYGGKATPRKLKLIRVPKDGRGGEWSLDSADVDGMFNRRLINRELASKLRKPRKLKPW